MNLPWQVAADCSTEMGYRHSHARCWWDNRVVVHHGPLWRLCSDCRGFGRDSNRLTWRGVVADVWWPALRDRWVSD